MDKLLVEHVAHALFSRFKIMADERGMDFTSQSPTSGDRQLAKDAINAVNSYKDCGCPTKPTASEKPQSLDTHD